MTEIVLTEIEKDGNKVYQFDTENPASELFGDSVNSLDTLTEQFVAYKIGEKEVDISVKIINFEPSGNQHILSYEKKGPLAKLLEARTRLKELLIRVDGKDDAQQILEDILGDEERLKSVIESAQS